MILGTVTINNEPDQTYQADVHLNLIEDILTITILEQSWYLDDISKSRKGYSDEHTITHLNGHPQWCSHAELLSVLTSIPD